jgi:hypothetical protein
MLKILLLSLLIPIALSITSKSVIAISVSLQKSAILISPSCTQATIQNTIWEDNVYSVTKWIESISYSSINFYNGVDNSKKYYRTATINVNTTCDPINWTKQVFNNIASDTNFNMTNGVPNYDYIYVIFPNYNTLLNNGISCGGQVVADYSGKIIRIFDCGVPILYAHGYMDTFGVGHAGQFSCPCPAYPNDTCVSSMHYPNDIVPKCRTSGDFSDASSGYKTGYTQLSRGINAAHMQQMGLIPTQNDVYIGDPTTTSFTSRTEVIGVLASAPSASTVLTYTTADMIRGGFIVISCVGYVSPYSTDILVANISSGPKIMIHTIGQARDEYNNDFTDTMLIRSMGPSETFSFVVASSYRLNITRHSNPNVCNATVTLVNFVRINATIGKIIAEKSVASYDVFWKLSYNNSGVIEEYDLEFEPDIDDLPIPGSFVSITGSFVTRNPSITYPTTSAGGSTPVFRASRFSVLSLPFVDVPTIKIVLLDTDNGTYNGTNWSTSTSRAGYIGSGYKLATNPTANQTASFVLPRTFITSNSSESFICATTFYWINMNDSDISSVRFEVRDAQGPRVLFINQFTDGISTSQYARKILLGSFHIAPNYDGIYITVRGDIGTWTVDGFQFNCSSQKTFQYGTRSSLFISLGYISNSVQFNSACSGSNFAILRNSLAPYISNISYTQLNIPLTDFFSIIDFDNTIGDCIYESWIRHILLDANNQYPTRKINIPPLSDVTIPDFDHIVIIGPNLAQCNYKSLSSTWNPIVFLSSCNSATLYHMMGHSLGMAHSGALASSCGGGLSSSQCYEMGDSSDIMGYSAIQQTPLSISGVQRLRMGWISQNEVYQLDDPRISLLVPNINISLKEINSKASIPNSYSMISLRINPDSSTNDTIMYVSCNRLSSGQFKLVIHTYDGYWRDVMDDKDQDIYFITSLTLGQFINQSIPNTNASTQIEFINQTEDYCIVKLTPYPLIIINITTTSVATYSPATTIPSATTRVTTISVTSAMTTRSSVQYTSQTTSPTTSITTSPGSSHSQASTSLSSTAYTSNIILTTITNIVTTQTSSSTTGSDTIESLSSSDNNMWIIALPSAIGGLFVIIIVIVIVIYAMGRNTRQEDLIYESDDENSNLYPIIQPEQRSDAIKLPPLGSARFVNRKRNV